MQSESCPGSAPPAARAPHAFTRAIRNAMTGSGLEPHRAVLRIPLAQRGLRPVVLVTGIEDLGAATQHHPCQPGPFLVVSVDDDGDAGVLFDVAKPLHAPYAGALRLLVDGHIEVVANDRVAHRDDVWSAVRVRRCEPGDAHRLDEPPLRVVQRGSPGHRKGSHSSASDDTATTPSGIEWVRAPGTSAKTCMPAVTPAAMP